MLNNWSVKALWHIDNPVQSQLSEQEIVRREKLSKLRALGIDPYPADLYPVDHTSKQIKQDYVEGGFHQ